MMDKALKAFRELVFKGICYFDEEVQKDIEIVEKALKASEIIKENFRLVGNCLQAKNPYSKDGWVFVKELENEKEHNAWKEVLL